MIGLRRSLDGVDPAADRWHSSSADDEIDLVAGGDFDERKSLYSTSKVFLSESFFDG